MPRSHAMFSVLVSEVMLFVLVSSMQRLGVRFLEVQIRSWSRCIARACLGLMQDLNVSFAIHQKQCTVHILCIFLHIPIFLETPLTLVAQLLGTWQQGQCCSIFHVLNPFRSAVIRLKSTFARSGCSALGHSQHLYSNKDA